MVFNMSNQDKWRWIQTSASTPSHELTHPNYRLDLFVCLGFLVCFGLSFSFCCCFSTFRKNWEVRFFVFKNGVAETKGMGPSCLDFMLFGKHIANFHWPEWSSGHALWGQFPAAIQLGTQIFLKRNRKQPVQWHSSLLINGDKQAGM